VVMSQETQQGQHGQQGPGAGAPKPANATPKEGGTLPLADLNRIVLEYLNKKGYTRTEAMLRMESSRTPTPASNPVGPSGGPMAGTVPRPPPGVTNSRPTTPGHMVHNGVYPMPGPYPGPYPGPPGLPGPPGMFRPGPPMEPPHLYDKGYSALKKWTDQSLDLYRHELRRVLYPVFVHMFLELININHTDAAKEFFEEHSTDHMVLHGADIEKLAGLWLPTHLEESELAKAFLSQEYRLQVSRTSLDLLLYFLHEIELNGGSIIIRILNQHMNTKVTSARPNAQDTERTLNPDEGLQGLFAGASKQVESFNSQPIKLGAMPMDGDFQKEVLAGLERKDKEEETELGKPAANSLAEEFRIKIKEEEESKDSPTRESLPLPKYKSVDVEAETKKIADSRATIKLGAPQTPLPSVCMYTMHNTHDGLNVVDFSDDSSLIAGGFADSFIKIWSLKGEKISSVLKDDIPSTSKRLIGHAGPVYGLSFSPDNRYLLSSSEDKTVRLWSLDTYSALVSYKGHNHPVWDVKFGPFGHYFATASHDQTARLWSCDHIYPLRIFAGHLSDVDTISFHPNGTYVFTGSSDKTCRMWDINKGNSVRVFIGHTGAVNCTAVSPDGRWLATAGEDSIINVWDIGSGRRLKSMKGHGRASIYSLAFSRDGTVLVSAGADCSVRTWDIKKGTFEGGPEPEPLPNDANKTGNGVLGDANGGDVDRKKKEVVSTPDHMAVFHTKRTPVYKVQFTRRNLCLAAGAFMG
jgi:transcription initiation factor TFIID subunit 5